ncbi:MAG TPA: methenyltetrahydromethanopterin cyclohydrolase [Methylotenera sp.]|nr:methenyltetrahydromethanopterin cyclohydrolase [Methylotenera sp.]HPH04847.1 methenyltetrahydromethanopterin cyclohydrolase [Methylotenera sp.]HPN02229.1 methenyltetrahydromethanopterin cyclohydrolase [Methylotenera sp.]
MTNQVSLNAHANVLVQQLIDGKEAYRVLVNRLDNGCTIVDAGIQAAGSIEAGQLIGQICMGGLGQVDIMQSTQFGQYSTMIEVRSDAPVLSCLASQYAGWALQHEKFFSLGSGPARAIAQREDLFKELNYHDQAEKTVLVLETDKTPPLEIIEKVSRDTNIQPENLTFILTPTKSIAGTTQIVARVLEVALHKAHTLHFPLESIVRGSGSAPLPPLSKDFLTAMGRTNDAILFGGNVQLEVKCSDAEAEKLARELPSSASKDYGRPFAEIFKSVNMDFYQIDPMLFSPAKVLITNVETDKKFTAGKLDEALLNQSFSD